jgi:hypothetical protein
MAEDERVFLLMAAVGGAGFLVARRAIEYAAPAVAVSAALYFRTALRGLPRRGPGAGLTALAFAAVLPVYPLGVRYLREGHIPAPIEFAGWARSQLPAGTFIANFHWQDFPRLFYAAPGFRFSDGLDPMFAYRADPDRHRRLSALASGADPFPPPGQLREVLGTPYVYLSPVFIDTARRMAAAGYALVYEGTDGWCFDLDAPLVNYQRQESVDDAPPAGPAPSESPPPH